MIRLEGSKMVRRVWLMVLAFGWVLFSAGFAGAQTSGAQPDLTKLADEAHSYGFSNPDL